MIFISYNSRARPHLSTFTPTDMSTPAGSLLNCEVSKIRLSARHYRSTQQIAITTLMEWSAQQSVTITTLNSSTSSVFVTGKEDIKRVSIKIVTGTETTSTPNLGRDESSVDTDNYVGVLDIEPVQTMECTAEETVTISEYNKSASSVFVTGKEDIKRVAIKIVTGTETISTPNPRRDESSVDRDNYVARFL